MTGRQTKLDGLMAPEQVVELNELYGPFQLCDFMFPWQRHLLATLSSLGFQYTYIGQLL